MTQWKEVADSGEFTMWNGKGSDLKKDDSIEGRYTETLSDQGPNNSLVHFVEVDNESKGIWGSTVLDRKFKQVTPGMMVKVVYNGKQKSEKTGREYHDYSLFYGLDSTSENDA